MRPRSLSIMTDAQNTPETGPNTEDVANTATSNDPLTDFSIPQDADIVADDAAGDPESHDSGAGATENNAAGNDSIENNTAGNGTTSDNTASDNPSGQSDRVAENPGVEADTPAEAEELAPDPG